MDATTNGQQPTTDDQELAKVLAGMNEQMADSTPAGDTTDQPPAEQGLQYEETGATPETDPTLAIDEPTLPEVPAVPAPEPTQSATPAPVSLPSVSSELEVIKKDALEQLRPLVDKLNLHPEEKFDTLLLIIRSTDDQSLLPAASEAAKNIEDEAKRAQALLDVIKEIDFFSSQA